ncbi:MAG TPA: hypothetical protein VFX02_13050 [Gammaproteobacteria bacterium]|nr:hypothetical protein [Gammaproteobacteria bacterium]
MKTFDLSFGTVTLLRQDLAEVIIDQGIEMNMDMIDEYHMFVSEFLAEPCAILINKINQYTYSFEAQLAISNLEKIKAIAAVTYSDASRMASETLMKLPTHKHWNMRIFSDRDNALRWLEQQLSFLNATPGSTPRA